MQNAIRKTIRFKRRQVLIGKISDLVLEKDKIAFENKKLERQLIRVKEDNNELKEENHIHNEFLNELGINRLFQEFKDLYVQNSSKVDIKLFKNIVERAAEILNSHVSTVATLREIGILPAIKTGRNYMFSRRSISRFQSDYEGLDLSNRVKAIEAFQIVRNRFGGERYGS